MKERQTLLEAAWKSITETLHQKGAISVKNYDEPLIKDGIDHMMRVFIDNTLSNYPERLQKMIKSFPDVERQFQETKSSDASIVASSAQPVANSLPSASKNKPESEVIPKAISVE